LGAHVAFSVGWIGALLAFFALAIAGASSGDTALVRGCYLTMDLVARIVLLPLALASLVSGVVQSLGTVWGLWRHYWVVFKLVITVLALVVFLLQLGSISDLAAAATNAQVTSARYGDARASLVLHAGVGLIVLLVPLFLSIYKPRGVTPFGRPRSFGDPTATESS